VNFLAIATAAIAFIGCTGNGIPNAIPVTIFAAPVNSNVAGREIDLDMTRAVRMGSRVPRSPSDPENSARGSFLTVSTLCLWALRRRGSGFVMVTIALPRLFPTDFAIPRKVKIRKKG
jgi:hypothetical protein